MPASEHAWNFSAPIERATGVNYPKRKKGGFSRQNLRLRLVRWQRFDEFGQCLDLFLF